MQTDTNTHHGDSGDAPAADGRGAIRRAWAVRDYRLVFGGSSASLLGDQFALIATPWLVLQITGDPAALGLVLAIEGLPRAAFMLVGGAIVDRLSPRRVMIAADLLRAVLTAAMAIAVISGAVHLWMVFGFALCFGAIAGFSVPAESSIVPTLIPRRDLQGGNALMMGATQLSAFVGPTLAGLLIAGVDHSLVGVGIAFGIDAATFFASAIAFALVRTRGAVDARGDEDGERHGLASAIAEAIRAVAGDPAMRFVFAVLAAINLFLVGPLLVGIPLIAHERLAEGAAGFGALMAAFALGNLGGLGVAGAAARPSAAAARRVILGAIAVFGVATALLSVVTQLWVAVGLLALVGAGNGYLAVLLFTWVQGRTPERMLGRTMSLVTFASVGLVSISQAAAGAFAAASLGTLLVGAGVLVIATCAWSSTTPGLRALAAGFANGHHHKE